MKREILIALSLTAMLATGCRKETFDERVTAEVEHFNVKEAPKRLDSVTTFDSMQYDPGSLLLSYYYTIETDLPADMFPTEDIKQELLRNLRSSLQLKAHKEHGLSFHYHYLLHPSGDTLVDCTFSPEDYK